MESNNSKTKLFACFFLALFCYAHIPTSYKISYIYSQSLQIPIQMWQICISRASCVMRGSTLLTTYWKSQDAKRRFQHHVLIFTMVEKPRSHSHVLGNTNSWGVAFGTKISQVTDNTSQSANTKLLISWYKVIQSEFFGKGLVYHQKWLRVEVVCLFSFWSVFALISEDMVS